MCCFAPCNLSTRCFSARAALSAMVIFAPFDAMDEPEKRSLNASPPPLVAFFSPGAGDLDGPPPRAGRCVATYDGVVDRELDCEPAAASIEKTSFCGRRGCPEGLDEMAPSFLGASAGLVGAVEFHRSAKESDIAEGVDQLQSVERYWTKQISRVLVRVGHRRIVQVVRCSFGQEMVALASRSHHAFQSKAYLSFKLLLVGLQTGNKCVYSSLLTFLLTLSSDLGFTALLSSVLPPPPELLRPR